MDEMHRLQVIRGLTQMNMVEMKATGYWGLTTGGRDFLDQLEVMRELDDRPATVREERCTGRSAPVGGAGPGDDVRPGRGRGRKTTKGGRPR